MRITGARVFDPLEGFVQRDIFIQGERFAHEGSGGLRVDAAGCYAIPGLIDIHLHGCVGEDFSAAGKEGLGRMAQYQADHGVTALCPATLTLPEPVLEQACRNMASHRQQQGAEIVGIHLEGPFVSPQKLGAQNPQGVQLTNLGLYYRLQSAANGMVKLISLAPELDGAMDFIREIGGEVTCSLAHTTASYPIAMEAFAAGARHVTHLYNAMPPFSHREPGVIGAAFDSRDCMVELICDGVHLHPAVVRATFQMFGDHRIVLISDSMMATGLRDGRYFLGGLPVQVEGNTARVEDNGAIAGSVLNLMGCLRTAVREMGIPLHSAVKCATVNPAKAIGVFRDRGSIEPGKYADLVLLNDDLEIRRVFTKGKPLGGMEI